MHMCIHIIDGTSSLKKNYSQLLTAGTGGQLVSNYECERVAQRRGAFLRRRALAGQGTGRGAPQAQTCLPNINIH